MDPEDHPCIKPLIRKDLGCSCLLLGLQTAGNEGWKEGMGRKKSRKEIKGNREWVLPLNFFLQVGAASITCTRSE